MNLHFVEIKANIVPGVHAIPVIDSAGWHGPGQRLTVPDNISLPRLPPYHPELNPVEAVRIYLRSNQLGNRVFDSHDAIVDEYCPAWNRLIIQSERIASIDSRPWAQVRQRRRAYHTL